MVYTKKKPKPKGDDGTGAASTKESVQESDSKPTPPPTTPTAPASASSVQRATAPLVVLAVVVTASVAAGFGGYYLLDQRLVQNEQTAQQQLAELNDTISELREQLDASNGPGFASEAAVEELTELVAELRSEFAQRSASDADTLAGLESRVTSFDSQRAQEYQELSEEYRALSDALAAIEQRIASLEVEQSTNPVATVALARLAQAVQGSQPFVHSLNAYEQASGTTVSPLLRLAAMQGIDTQQTLSDQFPSVARKALADGAARDEVGGLVGEWRGWLSNLVVVRPAEEISGTSPEARISQATARLEAGDLPAALAALADLPPGIAQSMSDWLEAVRLRVAAEAEVNRLLAATINQGY